jgi:hypothetical protein
VLGSSNITFQQSTSFNFGNITANGTAILANTVGDAVSFVAGDNISITGNATAKTVTFGVTGTQSTEISNGTSNVSIGSANANVTVGVNGTGNVAVFAASGLIVTGNVSGGNITTAGQASVTGNLTTASAVNFNLPNSSSTDVTISSGLATAFKTRIGTTATNQYSWRTNLYYTGAAWQKDDNTRGAWRLNQVCLTGNANSVMQFTYAPIGSTDVNELMTLTGEGLLTVTGNIGAGNITATGNVSANYFLGNGSQLSGIITSVANINNGTSNVSINAANANVTVGVNGTGNVAVFAASGVTVTGNILPTANVTYDLGSSERRWKDLWLANSTIYLGQAVLSANENVLLVNQQAVITGANANTISLSGNITGGNLSGSLITGTLTTAAQPNITSLGTLSSLTVTGITSLTGNLNITGNVNATGNLNYQNVSDLVVGDPLIFIGANNTGNLFDLGMIVSWDDGVYQHGGWVRDASDGTWKLFGNVVEEPTTTVDFANAVYEPMLAGSVTTIGNISGNYILGNGSQLTGIVAGGGIEWTTQANTSPASPVAGDFWYDSYTDKKYQYTNDGVSNYWVDQSFPTSYSSLAVTGNIVAGNVLITGNIVGNIVAQTITANVVGSVTGNLTGNVFGNLIGNSYGNSTGTHFGNVTGNLTGSVLTAAQPAITGVGTLSSLSVTGNITTSAYFFGDGSQLTGISSTGSFIANGTSNVSIATTNGNITATVSGTEILKITSAGIENSRANGVGNIGNSTTYFNTVFAKATSAQYADLAEMYIADAVYPPGTVLIFGGTHEVTASSISHDPRTAGVVSTNPSYLMNSGLAGPNTAAVALTGRVPCWVQGPVAKGDRLVNIDTGVAGRLDMDKYEVGCVIGKSLEAIKDSSLHLIEIAIGRY